VANYNVDIEVALRGARELKALKDSLKGVNKEVGKLNAATIKAGKALKGTFSAKDIGNVNNYSKAVAKAERALRNAAFGTEAEKKAVKALVTAQKEFNEQLDLQNKLLREEERLQGVNQPAPKAPKTPKTRRPGTQTFGVSGIDFMPIGGGEFVPGSPLFKQGLQRRAGAAVSAGAFPLLFGGGPGMAVGGALGGAISGSTFGPASIALQVLGGVVDELAVKAAGLGAALSPATADIDALVDSLGLVGSPTQDAIKSIRDLAGEEVALEEATRQLALLVGDEGVTALTEFGDASTRFGNALTQITTLVLAQITRLAKGPLAFAANAAEFAVLFEQAQVSKDPRLTELQKKLRAVEQPVAGGFSPTSGVQAAAQSARRQGIANDMVEIMKEINKQETERINKLKEGFRNASAQNVIANNNLKISELHADITNDQVYALEQSNIKEKAKLALLEDGADKQLIELERKTALNDLENKRNDLIERANDKAKRAAKRQSDAADTLAEKQQKAIDRRVEAVERELERTDRAFDKASSQLDAITQKHKDKMAFEREYSRLIQEGSTPAAAKQAIELKKQLLELERGYDKLLDTVDAQILKAEASLEDLKNQKGVTTEYEDQLKALDALKKRKEELEGKKKSAEGAIGEALAPKSDRQRLLEYMDDLQEKINEMMDPVRQLTALSETLGSAFTESFKGLVSGSMSAQQALANLFQRTADHFLDMAAEMIAAQIKMKILGIGLNFLGGGIGSAGNFEQGLGFGGFSSPSPTAGIDFGSIFGRANGGAVGAGRPYMVGERGPELFVPGAQGNIVPNHAMGSSNIVVNVDASGTQAQGDQPNAKALGSAIGAAVQAELIKQKRPGGLLA